MLIESARLIFIHIPKTGGTTFEHYLFDKYNIKPNDLYNKVHNYHSLQHCTYREIKKLARDDIDGYRIIAFIRNPFHRIISDLFHFQQVGPNATKDEVHEKVQWMFSHKETVNNIYLNWDNHLMSQADYLVDENGNIPKNITIIETSMIDKVLPKIGFRDFTKYPHQLANPQKISYNGFLLEKTKKLVRQQYPKDFQLFFDLQTGNLKNKPSRLPVCIRQ